MNNLDSADIRELFTLIDSLLISVGFSALIIGIMAGLYLQSRYDLWLNFKRGGDYCPLCNQDKGQDKRQGGTK